MHAQAENELAVVVEKVGLEPAKAKPLLEAFQPFFADAKELVSKAETIHVTDATQVTEIKASRDLRLKLRACRIGAEKVRKELKEDALRYGRGIDGLNNFFLMLVEPVEKRLLAQEEFAERVEAERKAKLKAERDLELSAFGVDTTHYQLGDMSPEAYAHLLESTKAAHEARLEAERKAEADRKAAEAARVAEEKRIREENARLRAEQEAAEAKARAEREALEAKAKAGLIALEKKAKAERVKLEAKARAEREKAEAEARKEREAREKVEAELAERKRKEEAERAAAEKARKKAERAPDREKLKSFVVALRAFDHPAMASKEAQTIVDRAAESIGELADWVEQEAEGL